MDEISKLYEIIYKIDNNDLVQIFFRVLIDRAENKTLTQIIDYIEERLHCNLLLGI